MISEVRPRPSLRFRGRSFLAFVLTPVPPIDEWLAELDAWLQRSNGFFDQRPVVLDGSCMKPSKSDLESLLSSLATRGIRILGVDGVEEALVDAATPPLVTGGREGEDFDPLEQRARVGRAGRNAPRSAAQSLIVESTVRSGQSLAHPQGDVTILGSVASGAEVMAGGSIHVYGALRGRVIAGSMGNDRARIFCRKLEAELLAISGFYRTSDDMDAALRGRPVQAWLEGETVVIAALN